MILVVILGALIAYPVIMRVLAIRVQPIRLRMAQTARELIASEVLGEKHKRVVKAAIDDAFDPKVMIVLAAVLPIYMILLAIGHSSTAFERVPPKLKGQFEEFMTAHTRSLAAANPIFFLILLIEMMVVGAVSLPFVLFARKRRESDPVTTRNLAVAKSDDILNKVWHRAQAA